MRRWRVAGPVTLVVAAMALAGCGAGNDAGGDSGSGRLTVVTTVAPITSIAANIGGDKVSITGKDFMPELLKRIAIENIPM